MDDTQNVHDGERGRKDKWLCILSNLARWAIILFMSYSWVILFIFKWKKSPIAQISFLQMMALEKKSVRGNDCNYFIHSVR